MYNDASLATWGQACVATTASSSSRRQQHSSNLHTVPNSSNAQHICRLRLQVPFSKHTPVFLAVTAAVFGASWLNSFAFTTPHTFSPEFLAEQAKIGNVMVSYIIVAAAGPQQDVACAVLL
jgi:D-alanyl-D-alanine carboxypeptidase